MSEQTESAKKDKSTFILELKLKSNQADEQELNRRFAMAGHVKNVLIKHAQKELNKLQHDRRYHELRQAYHELSDAEDIDGLKLVKTELNNMISSAGLTRTGLDKYVKVQQTKYRKFLDSHVCQSLADDVLDGVEKVLYDNGRHLHFKRNDEILSVRGKTNKQGVRYAGGYMIWLGLRIQARFKKGDKYAKEAMTHPIKYCRIVRKMVGARWHYYLQLILEGVPPIKHLPGKGDVGIDNGPSMFAVVGQKDVRFEVMPAAKDGYQEKITSIQQAMDRSRRSTNPDRYNPDGTVKKGIRKRWARSRRYRTLKRQLKGMQDRRARQRKCESERMANEIMAMGNRFVTEPLSYAGLKKRAKTTTINKKTGRLNSKKRFGKSIAEHAPGMVEEALVCKLGYHGLILERVNLSTYRASQYDHVADTYVKKKLDQRWVKVGGHWVQRDMYSAFLQSCPEAELESIDRKLCERRWENFLKMHDAYIESLRESGVKLPSCCGIRSKPNKKVS